MNSDTSKGLFTGLLVGAAVGSVIALLYAPRSGAETRQIVKSKASELKEKATKVVGKFRGSSGSSEQNEA